MATVCLATLAVILIGGCAAPRSDALPKRQERLAPQGRALRQQAAALAAALRELDPEADPQEAQTIAAAAVQTAADLQRQYRMVKPPLLHNLLVRLGLRQRGLCYHWTADLLRELRRLPLRSYRLHWGVAFRGSNFREHNSVVITAQGQAFERGLVLDGWRWGGSLFWQRVAADHYPWKELPPGEW